MFSAILFSPSLSTTFSTILPLKALLPILVTVEGRVIDLIWALRKLLLASSVTV